MIKNREGKAEGDRKADFYEKLSTYHSRQEYQREVTDWGKQWISHYCRVAVETTEEGDIDLIRGRILFKKQLSRLCQEPFGAKEKAGFREESELLMEWMKKIHQKAARYIARGGMINTEYIYRIFQFEDFEWYLFSMALMPEWDVQFERIFVALQDDFQKKYPTLDLCIRMYTLDEEEQHRLKIRVMERWQFLSRFFEGGMEEALWAGRKESLLTFPLYPDRRIVRFIYDMDSMDPLLEDCVSCHFPTAPIKEMLVHQKQLEILEKMYRSAGKGDFIYIRGEKDGGKKFLVKHLCRRLERPLLIVDMKRLLQKEKTEEFLVRSLARECLLKGNAVLCFADLETGQEEEEDLIRLENLIHCLNKTHLIPLITSLGRWQEGIKTEAGRCFMLKLPSLGQEERSILWKAFLEDSRLTGQVDINRLAGTYKLTAGAIERVVRQTETRVLIEGTEAFLEKNLYEGCQRQLVHSLGKIAVRISARYTMEDLVLADSQKQLLTDACNMVRYHHQVYEKWGFQEKLAYGKGVSMIFYGPPGTGKTMGAQAIASELNLELYRVDLSSVLSKYVGEAEKKLGDFFEQGQKSQSILFFDEADALFGKRSQVKDSQDKYANAATAFLLQKVEDYQGIIILATNLLQNFDQAFCRRFQFMIEFPFPDEERRREIWHQVLPGRLPRGELDFAWLAREFTLSGSEIKNIVTGAAFLAAGEGSRLEMVHILRTLKREKRKSGKNMIASDFGVYGHLMENRKGEEEYGAWQ